jgi:hypothetical protein
MPISTSKKLSIGALALLGAFLLAYVPATLNARAARVEQDRLTQKLEAALQVQLGMMSYEVNRDNYGLAAQLATPFFDGVQSAVAVPADPAVTHWMLAILARRDEMTSDLAQGNAEVKTKIAELYAGLFRLTQTPTVGPPAAASS